MAPVIPLSDVVDAQVTVYQSRYKQVQDRLHELDAELSGLDGKRRFYKGKLVDGREGELEHDAYVNDVFVDDTGSEDTAWKDELGNKVENPLNDQCLKGLSEIKALILALANERRELLAEQLQLMNQMGHARNVQRELRPYINDGFEDETGNADLGWDVDTWLAESN